MNGHGSVFGLFVIVLCVGLLPDADARYNGRVVGCDGVLGSGRVKDKCGVCGGDNTACEVFSGDYTEANMAIGYHKAFRIPKGAMYINVTEMAKSRNYLALEDSKGAAHINGNWKIDLPGNFTVGGTVFEYKRDARASIGEQFLAMGPTTENLFVVLIYQTNNPGIHYEYAIPSRNGGATQSARPQPPARTEGARAEGGTAGGGTGGVRNPAGNQQSRRQRPTSPSRGRGGSRSQVNVNAGQSGGTSPQTPRRPVPASQSQNPFYNYNRQRGPSNGGSGGTGISGLGPTSALSQSSQTGTVVEGSSVPGRNPQNPRTPTGTRTDTGRQTGTHVPGRNSQTPVDGTNYRTGTRTPTGTRTDTERPTGTRTDTGRQSGTRTDTNRQTGTRTDTGRQTFRPSTNARRPTTDARTQTETEEVSGSARGTSGVGGAGVVGSSGGRGSTYVPGGYRQPYGTQERYPFSQGGTQARTFPGGQSPVPASGGGGGLSPIPTGIQNPGQSGSPSNQQPQPQGSSYNRQQYGGRQSQNPAQTPGRGTSSSSPYSQFFRPQYQTGSAGGGGAGGSAPNIGTPPIGGAPYPGYKSAPNSGPQQPGVPNSQYSPREQFQGGGGGRNPGEPMPSIVNPYTSFGATLKENTRQNTNQYNNRYQPLTGPVRPGVAGNDNTDPSQQALPNALQPGAGGVGPGGVNPNEGQGNRLFNNRLQYMWFETGQSDCSVSCGGGLQQSIVECVQETTFIAVEDNLCDTNFKPNPRSRTCNLDPCPPIWEPSDWGDCSRTCGQGRQLRSVVCKQTYSQSLTTTVSSERCDQSTKPTNVQDCKLASCSVWKAGDWGQCSAACGEGRRQRQVICVDERSEQLDEDACQGQTKPAGTETCDMGDCVAKWFASDWSELCSSECGGGERTRDVVCATEGYANILGDGSCSSDQKPRHTKMCNNMPCGAKWFASLWGQCSAECGDGTQTRQVVCISSSDPSTILPDENCPMGDKPQLSQTCVLKECQGKWFKSDWSECSKTCGGGHRTRDSKCLDQELNPSRECIDQDKPEERQSCNIQQCSLAPPPDDACQDKFSYCSMVTQARLCGYSYYRNSCCLSCFGRSRKR